MGVAAEVATVEVVTVVVVMVKVVVVVVNGTLHVPQNKGQTSVEYTSEVLHKARLLSTHKPLLFAVLSAFVHCTISVLVVTVLVVTVVAKVVVVTVLVVTVLVVAVVARVVVNGTVHVPHINGQILVRYGMEVLHNARVVSAHKLGIVLSATVHSTASASVVVVTVVARVVTTAVTVVVAAVDMVVVVMVVVNGSAKSAPSLEHLWQRYGQISTKDKSALQRLFSVVP